MTEQAHRQALPKGYMLEEYQVGRVLGAGGFGLTYLGWDTRLDKPVAIKEYLPNDLAVREADHSVLPKSGGDEENFRWGLDRFLDEARTLARFRHPNIIAVHRYFEAHNTAYIVMEYAEGETLAGMLKRGVAGESRLLSILEALLDGLEEVHRGDFLHRDIKPGNILIRTDGSPVLVDFGAARQAIGGRSRSITSVVTPGYAPIEQYSPRGNQGPWTDIYALGAVMYKAVTGAPPPDATERVRNDDMTPAVEAARGKYSAALLRAIDWALAVDEDKRPQDVPAWRRALRDDAPARKSVATEPPAKPEGKPEVGRKVEGKKSSGPQTKRFVWITAAAVMLVIVVGLLEARRGAEEARQEAARVAERLAREEAAAEKRRAEAAARREAERLAREKAARYAVGNQFRDCPTCPQMVVLPAGSFMMGSPSSEAGRDDNEGPVHRVRIARPFAVGVYEVTRGEYARFVSATGHRHGDSCWTYEGGEWEERSGRNWRRPGFSQTDRHPVVCVSWVDARAYARWLSGETGESYRLLSESEWEYAARAGTTTAYYFGDRISSSQANYNNNEGRTLPVGSYPANGFGLHDVHGNVWEWMEDCWNDSYRGAPSTGRSWDSGDCRRRVLRGGSWYIRPRYLRSAIRNWSTTGSRNLLAGFRVARTLTP